MSKTKQTEKPPDDPIIGSDQDKLLTLGECAVIFGKTRQTIGNWVRDGLLRPVRMPSGLIAIRESEVRKFLGASALSNPHLNG